MQEVIKKPHSNSLNPEGKNVKNSFVLNDFEGPLDLLLFLIKKNDINIYDIPVSEITTQYLEWLEFAEHANLDNLTDFYSMASTLLYIKSKMLLPIDVDLDEELEDPRRELVDKLIEFQKIKKLTDLMQEKEAESEWTIERKKRERVLPFGDTEDMWEQIDVWDLVVSFKNMIQAISAERIIDLYEEVSINEKVTLLEELLDDRPSIFFTDLIITQTSLMEIICSFLAILDLVKLKKISIFQNKFFGDIQIRKNQNYKDDNLDYISEEGAEEPAT